MYGEEFVSELPRRVGHIRLVDEIAVEHRLRYDPANDMILGPCREHSKDYSLKFNSHDEAELV